MVNLWGPGAFGAARAAATRPSFTPSNGAGDPEDWSKDCSSSLLRDGTEWRAAHLNKLVAVLRRVVRTSSVPADNTDDDLLAKAIASGHATYAVATGTANAWVVAPALAVPAYAAGRGLNIIAPATNTSTTVNMAVSGLADRQIKKSNGTDPAIGDLVSGRAYPTIDDGTNVRILAPLASDIKAAASGMIIPGNVVAFATSGIYTPSVNMVACKVTMVGGGGAGGVGDTGGYLGGGGGSGAMIIAYFQRAQLAATEAVTIGGGGYGYPPTGMYGGEAGGNTTFKNMIAGGGGGGTNVAAHGASGAAGTFTIAGPGVAAGILGAPGPTGARWDTPSALGVYGRGGSGGSISYGLGGSAGYGGYAFIEEYLQS